MNKIRVIDLLNKIANGEEIPKKIKRNEWILTLVEDVTVPYYALTKTNNVTLGEFKITFCNLNDEIEIIEESKKIEYIPILKEDEIISINLAINHTRRKLNEIIEVINDSNK